MNLSRNSICWCGSGKKWKKCHYPLTSVPENPLAESYRKKWGIILKTKEQIAGIKKACRITAEILDILCLHAKAGVTTKELDLLSQTLHKERNVLPAPLGYGDPPYPFTICTSLNDEICHGFPNDHRLEEGDILNIDVSCIADGYFGDCSRMVMIGRVGEEKKRVVDASHESLMQAISILRPGIMLFKIGDTIEACAKEYLCSVVNQFVGHGVGLQFHEPPEVLHHQNNIQIPLAAGMTFTIEPMINAGVREAIFDENRWTARTADGKPSAQWEHTLLITEKGHEILTKL